MVVNMGSTGHSASGAHPTPTMTTIHAPHSGARTCSVRRALQVLLLLATLLPWWLFASPRIGVATMQPGEIFWERFGHNALIVADPATGETTSYNFGFFDLDEPDFFQRFIEGRMRYRLVALPLEQDLAMYRDAGRGVSVQWLALDDASATELAAALADNARPEHAHYFYDYFLDNCSTRVRDALDRALGGELRRQLEGRSRGASYRSESVRLASPAAWLWLGFDLGLGPAADRPLPLWAEAFVPMHFERALDGIRRADGTALVTAREPLLPHRIAPEPQEQPFRWPLWLASGSALAFAAAVIGRRAPRALSALAMPFWLAAGALGALMLFIWFGTAHRFGWANHNLWLLNPLAWTLLPGAWRLLRGRAPGRWFKCVLLAAVVLGVIGTFVHWLAAMPQQNSHWIALLLPLHIGLWLGLRHTDVAPRRR